MREIILQLWKMPAVEFQDFIIRTLIVAFLLIAGSVAVAVVIGYAGQWFKNKKRMRVQ